MTVDEGAPVFRRYKNANASLIWKSVICNPVEWTCNWAIKLGKAGCALGRFTNSALGISAHREYLAKTNYPGVSPMLFNRQYCRPRIARDKGKVVD